MYSLIFVFYEIYILFHFNHHAIPGP